MGSLSYNGQLWRFIYAKKNSEPWNKLFSLMVNFNKSWAKNAVLVVVISRKNFEHDGNPSVTHQLDFGTAWENLALLISKKDEEFCRTRHVESNTLLLWNGSWTGYSHIGNCCRSLPYQTCCHYSRLYRNTSCALPNFKSSANVTSLNPLVPLVWKYRYKGIWL